MSARDIEIIAVALRKYINDKGDPFDNIFSKNAIVRYFMEKDLAGNGELQRVRRLDGGEKIEIPLEYATGNSAQSYDGYDVIDFTPQETITNAVFEWRHIVQTLTMDKKDILKATGNNAKLANYVGSKLRNAQKSLRSSLNTQLLATSPGSKDFNSIPSLVQSDPTTSDTVGGIDQSASKNSWWRNKTKTSSASSWQGLMQEITNLRNTCAYNAADDAPDLFITDQTVYEYLISYLESKGQHTFRNDEMSKALDFDVIRVRGMDVIWDTGVPEITASTSTAYLLNTEYLQVVVHKSRAIELGNKIDLLAGQGQDAVGWPIFLMGNLTVSNRAKQGVLYGIDQSITS